MTKKNSWWKNVGLKNCDATKFVIKKILRWEKKMLWWNYCCEKWWKEEKKLYWKNIYKKKLCNEILS